MKKIMVFLILVALSMEEASAATTTYYFSNNPTSIDFGFDGTTDNLASGSTITPPYRQVYTTSTSGTEGNLRYTPTSTTTVYNVFRFYPVSNVTAYTQIGADIAGRVSYGGTSTTGRINVSIWDYNPVDGTRIKYGESTNVTTGGTIATDYDFQINNPAFNISAGHKVVVYVNVTTTVTNVQSILYFGSTASYIILSETPLPIAIIDNGNNVTGNNVISISVNQDTNARFNLTANLNIDSMTITDSSNATLLGNDTPGKTTMWSDFLFSNYGILFVNMTVFNTTTSASENWTITVNDVIPPDQVTNLTNITIPTHNAIYLGWDAGTDNNGGSGIKDYLIDILNSSINWFTFERPTINATDIMNGYENDAYWYTFKNNAPVTCGQPGPCHGSGTTKNPALGNFWIKFNSTQLFVMAHVQDNDNASDDDLVEIAFDVDKNGGTLPQTDDRAYELHENGTLIARNGTGTDWGLTASNASYAVAGAGTNGLRFEFAIPLSEIGNPTNNSSVKFMFKSECRNGTGGGSEFKTRSTYFPVEALTDTDPSKWILLTYRNVPQWDNIGTSNTTNYYGMDFISNYRYEFTTRARDNADNIGTRSESYTGQTENITGYNITGFVTGSGVPLSGAHVWTGGYMVLTEADGSYSLTDLVNGTYTVWANASEMIENSTIITINEADQTINFSLVDNVTPSVISNTNNVYLANDTFIPLSSTITDAGTGVRNATVNVSALNSTINESILILQGGSWINSSIKADKGETGGLVGLVITAYDNAGNSNNNVNMTAGIDDSSPLVASNANNVYVSNGSFLAINASITDALSGVKNATVNVSEASSNMNEVILDFSGGYWINNTIIADKGENSGFKNLTITTYDNAGNVNNSVNMTVWVNPVLEISNWGNNMTNDESIYLTVFMYDSVRFNVTANQNVTNNWSYDDMDQLINASNFSKQFSESGLHYIDATVTNSDSTFIMGWVINVLYKPDLVMNLENISFSYVPSEVENGEVKENVNVTINATVYNSGLGEASNINVSFYDGSRGLSNNIVNITITNISAGGTQNATINWTSIIGTHDIYIIVDPENSIAETDDGNNNASKTINVSGWQKYYGNVSGNLMLGDNAGNSFSNWSGEIPRGNVFISDIPSLNFNNLQALGRNKNGELAQNNFSRADEFLNMTPGSNNATGFLNNNITVLFGLNSTYPRNYTNFTVYGRKIEYVALVNSTDTTNFNSVETSPFITGILWDTTKDTGDGIYGDDGEDLVFITRINFNQTGLGNSSHNYETVIPSIIRNEGNVYFFVELK
ncbi:MAG: hypothetical protein C3F06_10670 [Candidatus Methanoperedenaceae archaeon]|nr:MAG: hypothetical protein C3F06_10670 [Candidatus Methanoperedenaceae archaeon]